MRNKGAGVWAGSHACGKGRWGKTSSSHAGHRSRGLPTTLGDIPAGKHTDAERWAGGWHGLLERTWRAGGGEKKGVLSHLRVSAAWGTAALRSHRSPPPRRRVWQPRSPPAATNPRRIQSHRKQHHHSSPKEIPPWVGNHALRSPSPSPAQQREGDGAGGRHRQAVAPTGPPSLATAGKRERRAKSPDSSEGGVAGTALPLTPRLPGSIYMAGFGGLFAENTFSLQVSYITSSTSGTSGRSISLQL